MMIMVKLDEVTKINLISGVTCVFQWRIEYRKNARKHCINVHEPMRVCVCVF